MRYRRPPAAFQRGAISLIWVAIGSVAVAGIAMAALFSMRYERNLFAEGAARLGKTANASAAGEALDAAGDAVSAASGKGDGLMRKCVIDGKTVISNTDCKAGNRTSKVIEIHDTKGIEAPRKPAPEKAAPGSDPMLDKMIEKQLR